MTNIFTQILILAYILSSGHRTRISQVVKEICSVSIIPQEIIRQHLYPNHLKQLRIRYRFDAMAHSQVTCFGVQSVKHYKNVNVESIQIELAKNTH